MLYKVGQHTNRSYLHDQNMYEQEGILIMFYKLLTAQGKGKYNFL